MRRKLTGEPLRSKLIPNPFWRRDLPPRSLFLVAVLFLVPTMATPAHAQRAEAVDSDHDGLSDVLENTLVRRFEPAFHISKDDCSGKPALFGTDVSIPIPVADDGTIYAQAFPRHDRPGEIELHYYHLWGKDCGRLGHALDAEHVSVLLRGTGNDPKQWHAAYWYAAAHEDTVCDASQVTRASTLQAEDKGAEVWISAAKHASYLNEELCRHGCGGDRCEQMEPLRISRLINLGEANAPAYGTTWASSTQWPLLMKMTRSDFRPALLQRVDALPETDIAWAEPAKRPAQAAILGGNRAVDGALVGSDAAGHGVATGGRSTGTAISIAQKRTGNALGRSVHAVGSALGKATEKTAKALGAKQE